ncbi:hypothetical protein DFH09DRAFT_1082603 [Mycena vulgaris]|nr:hypothetical protein DFH09DRAFT_1082603 [Mycena vulgaris]
MISESNFMAPSRYDMMYPEDLRLVRTPPEIWDPSSPPALVVGSIYDGLAGEHPDEKPTISRISNYVTPSITPECQAGLEVPNAVDDDEDDSPPAGDVLCDGVDIQLSFFRDLLADKPIERADAIRSLAGIINKTLLQSMREEEHDPALEKLARVASRDIFAHLVNPASAAYFSTTPAPNLREDDTQSQAAFAHSLILKPELSGQQVASYLLDLEDHFTSHEYTTVYWTSFESHINKEDPSPKCYPAKTSPVLSDVQSDAPKLEDGHASVDEERLQDPVELNSVDNEMDEITITLDVKGKLVPSANQACYYQLCGDSLKHVNVWDFVAQTKKERIAKKKITYDGESDREDNDADEADDPVPVETSPRWNEHNILDFEGGPMPKVKFLNDHLKDDTDQIKVLPHRKQKVPVPIGSALLRRYQPASVKSHV